MRNATRRLHRPSEAAPIAAVPTRARRGGPTHSDITAACVVQAFGADRLRCALAILHEWLKAAGANICSSAISPRFDPQHAPNRGGAPLQVSMSPKVATGTARGKVILQRTSHRGINLRRPG